MEFLDIPQGHYKIDIDSDKLDNNVTSMFIAYINYISDSETSLTELDARIMYEILPHLIPDKVKTYYRKFKKYVYDKYMISELQYYLESRESSINDTSIIFDLGLLSRLSDDEYDVEKLIDSFDSKTYLEKLKKDCLKLDKDFKYNDEMYNELVVIIASLIYNPAISINIFTNFVLDYLQAEVSQDDLKLHTKLTNKNKNKIIKALKNTNLIIDSITIQGKKLTEYGNIIKSKAEKLYNDVVRSMVLYNSPKNKDKFQADLYLFKQIISLRVDILCIFIENYEEIESQLLDLITDKDRNRELDTKESLNWESKIIPNPTIKPVMVFNIDGVSDIENPTVTDKLLCKNKEVINYYKEMLKPAICRELIRIGLGENVFEYGYEYLEDITAGVEPLCEVYKQSKNSKDLGFFIDELQTDYCELFNVWDLVSKELELYLKPFSGYIHSYMYDIQRLKGLILTAMIGLHLSNYETSDVFYNEEHIGLNIDTELIKKIKEIELNKDGLNNDYVVNIIEEIEPIIFAHQDIVEEMSKRIEKETRKKVKSEDVKFKFHILDNDIIMIDLLNLFEVSYDLRHGNYGKEIKFSLQEYLERIKEIVDGRIGN